MTEQELNDAIDNLQAILNSGATETVRDGHSVKFDHDSIRATLRELKAELDTLCGNTVSNRLFYGMNLNGRSCS
tara:strand:+ start:71 stop:292 length:222 start_codon:yes stop_codon:yes gene_type:complete